MIDSSMNRTDAAAQDIKLATPAEFKDFLDKILTSAIQQGASDIHLKVGSSPRQRINGELQPMDRFGVLTIDMLKNFTVIIPPKQRQEFISTGDSDYAYAIPTVGRLRVNTYLQRGTPGFAFRVIPKLNFSLEDIGLPEVIKTIAMEPRGLILVTGTTGCGKSTTLAGMLDYINSNDVRCIVTLEDPIEFLHNDKKSIIAQREVGSDTSSFSQGLRRALRQDPDVILVGEMRDLETIQTVIHSAETGHLVLSTLHTVDAKETINRIISIFPPHEQQQIRIQLANVLKAVISQRLVPRKDLQGRVPAVEIMINTAAIKECIIDPEKTDLIEDYMNQGRVVYKSQTYDQSLYSLVVKGIIDEQEALNWVKRKDDFKLTLKGISSGSNEWMM